MFSFKKICKYCRNYVRQIDFFATKPSDRITYNKSIKYSTLIGRFTSWLIIGIIITAFINFGNDMLYRKNPQSIFSQIVTPDPENLDLNEIGFFMAFGLQNLSNFSKNFIDEKIYRVEMLQRKKINGTISYEEIPIVPCDLGFVPSRNDLKSYYKQNQINYLYCIDPNMNDVGPELKSTWDGIYYKNILINIYPCVNSTKNNNSCRSFEFIENQFNNANFAIYFTTEAIDPNNFWNPVESYGKQIYTPISFSTQTYIEMLFGHFNFKTDKGFLFNDYESIESAYYLSNRQILSFRSNVIVQIDMKLDKVKTIYSRSYQKIQNVLASLGGIIKALMILANLIAQPFIKLNFRLNLANSIFSFNVDQDSQNIIRKKKTKGKKSWFLNTTKNSPHPGNHNQNSLKNKENKNDQPKSTRAYSRSKTKQISLSYFGYFFSFFKKSKSSEAKKLLKKGLSQIDEVLDISYIMKKLVEIDLLKLLILNENQMHLFDCIPKPAISINDNTQIGNDNLHMKFSYFLQKNPEEKAQHAAISLEKMIKKNTKNKIDKKLINILGNAALNENKKKKYSRQNHHVENIFQLNKNCLEDIQKSFSLREDELENHKKLDIILFDEEEEKKKEEEEKKEIDMEIGWKQLDIFKNEEEK